MQLGFTLDRPRLDLGSLCDQEEERVVRALRWGREQARRVGDVAAEAGLPERHVQHVIQHLLLEHRFPIGTAMSEPFGNYLIESAEDLEQTVELLRRRGISNLVRAAALKKMTLQQYLDLVQTNLLEDQGQ